MRFRPPWPAPEAQRPAPMPDVRPALLNVADLAAAVDRAGKAWNKSQLTDALRSARFFLERAEQAAEPIPDRQPPMRAPVPAPAPPTAQC